MKNLTSRFLRENDISDEIVREIIKSEDNDLDEQLNLKEFMNLIL